MGNRHYSRRKFFKNVVHPFQDGSVDNPNSGDPLFEKYSRKSGGQRLNEYGLHNFSTEPESTADARVNPVTSGLSPYTGSWTISEVLHLLRRTGFGYKKSDADNFLAMGMDASVEAVLTIETQVSPPVNHYHVFAPDENGLPYGTDWTNDVIDSLLNGFETNKNRILSLIYWMMGQALTQNASIREKMTWFWYHIMPVDFGAVYNSGHPYVITNCARILYQYMKMFRDFSGGNFKLLIKTMAKQPAMMFYLNNQANSADAPDENFARELMELFTLGKDPASQFTQEDVVEAAKVLTGWRVQNLNSLVINTEFHSDKHDYSNKQFSSFFNNTVIQGTGASEFDALIDMIFTKEQIVSEYICRRLYRYFIYYDIDANIEQNVIVPLAQTLVANDWEISPVLIKLFKSEHFYDLANRGVIIKSPFDLIMGTYRTCNINLTYPDPTNIFAKYQIWGYQNIVYASGMQQMMGTIINIAGWSAYYQSPAFHQLWINSETIQRRHNFLTTITNGVNLIYNTFTFSIKLNPLSYIQQFDNNTCADPNLLVSACIQYLFPINLSQSQKDSIKAQTLLYQQTNDSYWTMAWNSYLANPNTTNNSIVTDRARSLIFTLIQLSEYQLM